MKQSINLKENIVLTKCAKEKKEFDRITSFKSWVRKTKREGANICF